MISTDIDTIINSFRSYDDLKRHYDGTDYNWKHYVKEYTADKDDTDETLSSFPNLTTLRCRYNKNFTDAGLRCVPNLTTFYCNEN